MRHPLSPAAIAAHTVGMASEEEASAALVSHWRHYGVSGLILGIGGTLVGLWRLTSGDTANAIEMGRSLVVLCPLITVLALVSLTIARRMRAEALLDDNERDAEADREGPARHKGHAAHEGHAGHEGDSDSDRSRTRPGARSEPN
jgi:hypothetical protein